MAMRSSNQIQSNRNEPKPYLTESIKAPLQGMEYSNNDTNTTWRHFIQGWKNRPLRKGERKTVYSLYKTETISAKLSSPCIVKLQIGMS